MSDILLTFHFHRRIKSLATQVIFVHVDEIAQPLCLKLWKPCHNDLYDTNSLEKCAEYLLEGLEFNRRFAPNVYLGLAPVIEFNEEAGNICLGKLVENPEWSNLETKVPYALVMRYLKENWRLDHQLNYSQLGTHQGIELLATEVTSMHRMLEASPKYMGTIKHIASKLELNTRLFKEALDKLTQNNFDTRKYSFISNWMKKAYEKCAAYFGLRYEMGRIKRCHGDLKATNLFWVQPEKASFFGLKQSAQHLMALDCVDFNPSFCHVDILSDIAMLAIDIEAHLANYKAEAIEEQTGQEPVRYFLETYLEKIGEKSTKLAWTLLEYYMTEKAMICAYMSILYNKLPQFDRRYLDIALIHAQRLESLLELQA